MKPQVSGLCRVITFISENFPTYLNIFILNWRRVVNHLTADISQMLANKCVACTGQHHWEHVKKADSQPLVQINWIKICILTNFLCESQKYSSLKSTVLYRLVARKLDLKSKEYWVKSWKTLVLFLVLFTISYLCDLGKVSSLSVLMYKVGMVPSMSISQTPVLRNK